MWACAGIKPGSGGVDPVYVTDRKAVTLLPPSALPGTLSFHQSIEGYYGDLSYSLEGYVRADRKEISMFMFTPFGSGAYEISYNGMAAAFRSGLAPAGAKPEYLIADFQFCYFPAEALHKTIALAGLIFWETATPDGWHRVIADGDRVVIEIRRAGSELVYANHLRRYGYTIRELPD